MAALVEGITKARTRKGGTFVRADFSDATGQFSAACFEESLVPDFERWAAAGEPLKVVLETDSLFHLANGVSHGLGCAVVSAGIAACVPGGHDNPFRLVRDADMALYHAKRQGRNRCVRAVDQASPPSADIVILNAPRP